MSLRQNTMCIPGCIFIFPTTPYTVPIQIGFQAEHKSFPEEKNAFNS